MFRLSFKNVNCESSRYFMQFIAIPHGENHGQYIDYYCSKISAGIGYAIHDYFDQSWSSAAAGQL